MTKQIAVQQSEITFTPGAVNFINYEAVKQSVIKLAEGLKTVEVTSETIQQSKKLRGAVNKEVKNINDYRISLKKKMLAPYQDFENQVKEITDIAKEANDTIDQQVKELEEQERQEKYQKLVKLFNLHVSGYEQFPFNAETFIEAHRNLLTKSVSMSKAEVTIAQWIQKTQSDITAIRSQKSAIEIMAIYTTNGFNLGDAITVATQREQQNIQAETALESHVNNETKSIAKTTFLVNREDAKTVEAFLIKNQITYTKGE